MKAALPILVIGGVWIGAAGLLALLFARLFQWADSR